MTITNSNNTTNDGLIKIDSYGRRLYKKQFREDLLDAFEKSSMSGATFAKEHGVRPQTFATWIQRRKQKSRLNAPVVQKPSPPLTLVSVELEENTSLATPLELRLPGGVMVKMESEQQAPLLKSLLTALSC